MSMDGTAIYMPSVMLWLAAKAGVVVSAGQVVVLVIMATLASAGASPTPGLIGGTILCWGTVFPGTPLPQEIAFIAAVDWFVDRCVTTVNITGDSLVVRMVDHYVRQDKAAELEIQDIEEGAHAKNHGADDRSQSTQEGADDGSQLAQEA